MPINSKWCTMATTSVESHMLIHRVGQQLKVEKHIAILQVVLRGSDRLDRLLSLKGLCSID